jgi:competence protein ComGC
MDETNRKSKSPRRLLKIGIILGILALLVLIAIPNFIHEPYTSPMNACINNLRRIDAVTQQWALENNVTNTETVITWNDVKHYLERGSQGSLVQIYCPEDKTKTASSSYTLGDFRSPPKCKINPAHILQ